MKHRVVFSNAASRDARKLHPNYQRTLDKVILALVDDPRPSGVVKLGGKDAPTYRLRVREFRLIYEIHDDELLILVLRIKPRGAVYKK